MDYLQSLLEQRVVTEAQYHLLKSVGVFDPISFYALVTHFPGLHQYLPVQHLSSVAQSQMMSHGMWATNQQGIFGNPPIFPMGANNPGGATAGLGTQVPLSTPPRPRLQVPAQLGSVDLDHPSWVVKDQGLRGTCVAHAVTACIEQSLYDHRYNASEQFMFWACKQHDGALSQDGSTLSGAKIALEKCGYLPEVYWAYNPRPGVTVCQKDTPPPPPKPSQDDLKDALAEAANAPFSVKYTKGTPKSGDSQRLRQDLADGCVVAISLPVFRDVSRSTNDNWNTFDAVDYGFVLNPVPSSVIAGGHAVCVVGFVADDSEENGGFFIVRNSWGDRWAGRIGSMPVLRPGHYVRRRGYGQVSATYVENWLWEALQLSV